MSCFVTPDDFDAVDFCISMEKLFGSAGESQLVPEANVDYSRVSMFEETASTKTEVGMMNLHFLSFVTKDYREGYAIRDQMSELKAEWRAAVGEELSQSSSGIEKASHGSRASFKRDSLNLSETSDSTSTVSFTGEIETQAPVHKERKKKTVKKSKTSAVIQTPPPATPPAPPPASISEIAQEEVARRRSVSIISGQNLAGRRMERHGSICGAPPPATPPTVPQGSAAAPPAATPPVAGVPSGLATLRPMGRASQQFSRRSLQGAPPAATPPAATPPAATPPMTGMKRAPPAATPPGAAAPAAFPPMTRPGMKRVPPAATPPAATPPAATPPAATPPAATPPAATPPAATPPAATPPTVPDEIPPPPPEEEEEESSSSSEPTPEPAKPAPAPAKPTPEPAKPTPEPAKPTPEPAKPAPEPAKPAPAPAKPAPAPAKPAPEPAKPAPAPEPAKPAPAPAPAKPAPAPTSEPEPAARRRPSVLDRFQQAQEAAKPTPTPAAAPAKPKVLNSKFANLLAMYNDSNAKPMGMQARPTRIPVKPAPSADGSAPPKRTQPEKAGSAFITKARGPQGKRRPTHLSEGL